MSIVIDPVFYATSMHSFRDFKNITNPVIRTELKSYSQKVVNKFHPFQKHFQTDHAVVEKSCASLNEDGVAILQGLLSQREIADILSYLETLKIANNDGVSSSYYYPIEAIYESPHLFDKLFNKHMMSIIAKYLGVTPTVITADIYKTTSEKVSGFEILHRDRLDFHTATFILYLSDVGPLGGATGYLKNSHTLDGMTKLLQNARGQLPSTNPLDYFDAYLSSVFDENESELLFRKVADVFGDNLLLLAGRAGNLNIFDPFGYHVGTNVKQGERIVVRVVFALTPKIPFEKSKKMISINKINSKNKIELWMKYVHRIFVDF